MNIAYTCIDLWLLDIFHQDIDGLPECCLYCHAGTHTGDEDGFEIVTLSDGRAVSLCCQMDGYVARDWLERAIREHETQEQE